MKAAVYYKYGSPDVISVTQVEKPEIAEDEYLIEVACSTVNRTDTGFRSAEYIISRLFSGLLRPKQPILGCEFTGTVVEVGARVTRFKVGDRVVGFDDSGFGGHAEFVAKKDKHMVVGLPDSVSFKTAAAALEGAHYSLFYISAAHIDASKSVLLNGGTGAIGSAAIQILASKGVSLTATAPSEHVNTVRRLGAKQVIDWQKNDFTQIDQHFDIVFDAVGKSSFKKCKPLLNPKGIYMSTELGKYAQNPFLALWTRLNRGKRVLFPLPSNSLEDAEYLVDLLANGDFRPLIDSEYDLDNIIEATKHAESGTKIGNIVISIK